jgi:hypothetical protein
VLSSATDRALASAVNTGYDVEGNQFDLQMGAGGAGIFDICVGAAGSMFDGGLPAWGWAGRAGGIITLGTLGRCIIWRCPRTLRKQEPIVPTHSKESKARHHSELPPVGAGHNARHNACGCAAARIMMPGSRTKRSNA